MIKDFKRVSLKQMLKHSCPINETITAMSIVAKSEQTNTNGQARLTIVVRILGSTK